MYCVRARTNLPQLTKTLSPWESPWQVLPGWFTLHNGDCATEDTEYLPSLNYPKHQWWSTFTIAESLMVFVSSTAEAPRSHLVDNRLVLWDAIVTIWLPFLHRMTLRKIHQTVQDHRRQKKIHVPSRSPVMTRSHTVSRRKGNVEQHENRRLNYVTSLVVLNNVYPVLCRCAVHGLYCFIL